MPKNRIHITKEAQRKANIAKCNKYWWCGMMVWYAVSCMLIIVWYGVMICRELWWGLILLIYGMVVWCDMIWYCMIFNWYGCVVVWYCSSVLVAWYGGVVCCAIYVLCDVLWCCVMRCDEVWYWFDVVWWCDMIWYCVVFSWCGCGMVLYWSSVLVMWCDTLRCDIVWCGEVWYCFEVACCCGVIYFGMVLYLIDEVMVGCSRVVV